MQTTLLNAKATVPKWNRNKLVPRIVHLGFGAFHRAHQAVYADILAAEHNSDWGYVEVNLIGGEQQIADLKRQGLLYSVAEMSAHGWEGRVIGVVKQASGRWNRSRTSRPVSARNCHRFLNDYRERLLSFTGNGRADARPSSDCR